MRKRLTALLLGVVFLAGCSAKVEEGAAQPPGGDAPPVAKFTTAPADGATGVPVNLPVRVTVAEGTIDQVALTNPEGEQVEGALSEDRRSWASTEPLGFGKSYAYTGQATGSDGRKVELKGAFTTLEAASQVRATLFPGDDQVVGVAIPIMVRFEADVADRAAVEKALTVTNSANVKGSWAWLNPREVHYRPEAYWPADTEVHVEAKLYGVHYGGGAYGRADVTSDFTIGRNQVVKIHTPSHQLVVQRDGATVATYPASFGRDADPELTTPNGTFVVMQKDPQFSFDNPRYGYTNVLKKWAVRFSNHGEFIHENNDNAANIGRNNTSHGCANLLEADAKAYYDSALVGDPVEVTGSITTLPAQYDWYDWQIPWAQWQTMSAL
ncbi:L,D-transpeptidase [Saccharothrix algeriensis]|uniref:L,D-transpeptidase family protein n=1 Tax=Saccharothrix algeriensis TaxID=173560 RepID=A0A8T8HSB6_9PSEU|nr:Ig-like domain-containing protein [Saccharothrix algeriensis]MBM7812539.1 lipoprotein-anchoring transpeptidase ErfK/SrfK [Saccharothrix algeriensis]QTR01269.1 L,D-transpeptidase family protein [Saccharothrix algeriensis]